MHTLCKNDDGQVVARDQNGRKLVYVSEYEVCQRFGGPEEGGWYYDCGEPTGRSIVCLPQNAKAIRAKLERAQKADDDLVPFRHSRYSACNGTDTEWYIEDSEPAAFPKERPRYC